MKLSTKIVTGIVTVFSLGATGFGIASAITPALPTEQQALLNAGYTQTADWGKFEKQSGACHLTVMLSGKNYYVFSSGKLYATLYPVVPKQTAAGAALMDANCQG